MPTRSGFPVSPFIIGFVVALAQPGNSAIEEEETRSGLYPRGEFVARTIDPKAIEGVNNTRDDWEEGPIEPGRVIAGRNRFEFTAFNSATGDRISEFTVQAGILLWTGKDSDRAAKAAGRRVGGEYKEVGRLESRRISNRDATCSYELLGEAVYTFQVWAPGFAPRRFRATIPGAGSWAAIELDPERKIRGKVVDGPTGVPVQGLRVEYRLSNPKNYWTTWDRNSHIVTDQDGRFEIGGLPADEYALHFPDLAATADGGQSSSFSSLGFVENGRLTHSKWSRHSELSEVAPVNVMEGGRNPPRLAVDLRETEERDFETIILKPVAVLDIELVDEADAPLGNFPIELHQNRDTIRRLKTDANARITIPLVSLFEGSPVAVFAPHAMSETYKLLGWKDSGDDSDLEGRNGSERYLEYFLLSERSNIEVSTVEQLPTNLRSKFDAYVAKEKEREIEEERKLAARPEHPSAHLVHPSPGERIQIKLVYHPSRAEANLTFLVRDIRTRQPLPEFGGLLLTQLTNNPIEYLLGRDADWNNSRTIPKETTYEFKSGETPGLVRFDRIPIPQESLKTEHSITERKRESLGKSDIEWEERRTRWAVILRAPGFAERAYELPLSRIREGKPIPIDMEPEAIVAGRLIFTPTGRAPSLADVKTALVGLGRWNAGWDQQLLRPSSANGHNWIVRFHNNQINPPSAGSDRIPRYRFWASAYISDDGSFQIRGLKPDERWWMTAEMRDNPYLIPNGFRRGVKLHEGVNNLGDIHLGLPGRIQIVVTDQNGNAIPRCRVTLPGDDRGSQFESMTGSDGSITFDTTAIGSDPDRVIRLSPPWIPERRASIYLDHLLDLRDPSTLSFDARVELPPHTDQRLNFRIDRGHTLIVEIPATESRQKIARGNVDRFNRLKANDGDPSWRNYYWSVSDVTLLGLRDAKDELADLHNRQMVWATSSETSESIRIRIPHVPPGRHALRVNGAIYSALKPEKRRSKRTPEAPQQDGEGSMPFGYMEFEMPDADHRIELCLNPTEIEIRFEPEPELSGEITDISGHTVLFDREGPTLLGQGPGGARVIIAGNQAAPLLGYWGSFHGYRSEGSRSVPICPPTRLCGVPAGRYQLSLFTSYEDYLFGRWSPYYRTQVEILPGEELITIPIPFKPKALIEENVPAYN